MRSKILIIMAMNAILCVVSTSIVAQSQLRMMREAPIASAPYASLTCEDIPAIGADVRSNPNDNQAWFTSKKNKILEICKTECDAKNINSCMIVALTYDLDFGLYGDKNTPRSFSQVHSDYASLIYYDYACQGEIGEACARAGEISEAFFEPVIKAQSELYCKIQNPKFAKLCEIGRYKFQYKQKNNLLDAPNPLYYYAKGCHLKNAKSCAAGGELLGANPELENPSLLNEGDFRIDACKIDPEKYCEHKIE